MPRQGGNHGCHGAFDVACTAAVDATIAMVAGESVDDHAVGGDRVLVDVPENQLAAVGHRRHARNEREEVFSAGMDFLPQPSPALLFAKGLQIVGEPLFAKIRADGISAHGVHAGNPNQLLKRFDGIKSHQQKSGSSKPSRPRPANCNVVRR